MVVTLVGVGLGGRIEYLRRSAVFHEQEANRCLDKIAGGPREFQLSEDFVCGLRNFGLEDTSGCIYHKEMAKVFREATYRPWLPVTEPSELAPFKENLKQ